MKLAIISFARKGSTRLPNKNMMKINGIPLVWYTMRAMNYVYLKLSCNGINCDRYMLTDSKECKELALEKRINVIWRNHPKEWDDIRLNQWAHEKIKADNYLLLQPTSPLRDNDKVLEWVGICLNNGIQSAFSVKFVGYNIYKRAGSFFFYSASMLDKGILNDDESVIFQDNNDIDIDTIEDLKKAEEKILNDN